MILEAKRALQAAISENLYFTGTGKIGFEDIFDLVIDETVQLIKSGHFESAQRFLMEVASPIFLKIAKAKLNRGQRDDANAAAWVSDQLRTIADHPDLDLLPVLEHYLHRLIN